MGTPVTTGWIDYGTHLRVYADIPLRRNGLPNHAAREAATALLNTLAPDSFDPIEPVPESVAKAAMRDNVVSHVEISADHPPVPVFDDEEIPGYRCANGACVGD